MIEFNNIRKVYPDGTEALKKIRLTIPDNKLTVIIGPSGCGKTTLMKLINRLEKPTSGEVIVNGRNIGKENPTELRRSIGYVIQRIGLFPHMTIEENISLVPNLKRWDKERTHARVLDLLDLVGLEPEVYLKKYPLELSGGQQQRIGVARALASEPEIILMDEPFSALDPISREQLQIELKNLQKQLQKTIVFVTHDMDEALKIADNIIVMKDGKVLQEASPDKLVRHPADDFVRDFIGAKRLKENLTFKNSILFDMRGKLDAVVEGAPVVQSSFNVAQSVLKFEQLESEYLNVEHEGDLIGSISRQMMLNAFVNEGVL